MLFFQVVPYSEEDKKTKLQLCSKYLEMFTRIKEREKSFVDLSIDLLVGMRNMLQSDPAVSCSALIYFCTTKLHSLIFLHGP